ncbi:hypothetical protein AAFF_G00381550 [Aldrovandia affinis]|uniref:Uncharacterized protein n=1 Tax=Aldrovandia affinis TaxID=143900 RepID=A0AAD7T963_9TELE|nr:hypothetical protein AAFF_G00381550 [Aldrovandia affinis]
MAAFLSSIMGDKSEIIIDTVAELAKDQLAGIVGGDTKEEEKEEGFADAITNTAKDVMAKKAADNAMETALDFELL